MEEDGLETDIFRSLTWSECTGGYADPAAVAPTEKAAIPPPEPARERLPEIPSESTPDPRPEPPRDAVPEPAPELSQVPSSEGTAEPVPEPVRKPRRIGARRARTVHSSRAAAGRSEARLTPRPELVCREDPGSWLFKVALDVPQDCGLTEVRFDGELVAAAGGEYCLASLAGALSVVYPDREPVALELFSGKPMVFKFRDNWRGLGRKVARLTRGHFIVITPEEWERLGQAPVESRECSVPGFMAHYFVVPADGPPTESALGFVQCELASTGSRLVLIGENVLDDSIDGRLFVGAVPELRPVSSVVWARVGEEKEGGWRGVNFRTSEKSLSDVLSGRQGRFFVRVFDERANLIDSEEFRYLRDLREIRVNGVPYSADTLLLPSGDGHSSTTVQFVGVDGADVRPVLKEGDPHAAIQPDATVAVATHPDGDDLTCSLESDTGSVETVLRLPRVWWRITSRDREANEWRDKPLPVTRREFRELAPAGSTLEVRLPVRVGPVSGGFGDDGDRQYRIHAEDAVTRLRLADFVDYPQIDQRLVEDALLSVRCGDWTLPLVRVARDPVPEIALFDAKPVTLCEGGQAVLRWATLDANFCDFVIEPGVGPVESSGSVVAAPTETTTFRLKLTAVGMKEVSRAVRIVVRPRLRHRDRLFARVKRAGGGSRRGRGFSRSELHAAGLTVHEAACMPIRIDRRRRTTHRENVYVLRSSSDA